MPNETSQYFVLRPKSAEFANELRAKPAGSSGLYILHNPRPLGDAREEWEKLIRGHGDQIEFAAPIILDRRGQHLLPTGKIVVEFYSLPTDEMLERLQSVYGLCYISKNQFKKEQVSFAVRNPKSVYPPDLVARVAADSEVKLAVPETLGRYSRV